MTRRCEALRLPRGVLCSMDALYCWPARLTSFVLASALSLLILIQPQALVHGDEVQHGALTLLLWGVSAGFVHGVGFVPMNRLARFTLGPIVGIPVMTLGSAWLWLS